MVNDVVSADALFDACTTSNLDVLGNMLQRVTCIARTVETEVRAKTECILFKRSQFYLRSLFENAAKTGSATMVKYLLSFAKSRGVPYDALVCPDSICAAMESNNSVAVFKELLAVRPDIVNFDLGHLGTPLTQAIFGSKTAPPYSGHRAPLVRFLLAKGADPHGIRTQYYYGPGTHLENAVCHSSTEVIELLLNYGANIKQSGALHSAAERGRIDVMNLLLKHGADVNEPLWDDGPTHASRSRDILKKYYGINSEASDHSRPKWTNETPLHFSVLYRQAEATAWLLEHGADVDAKDEKGWSAGEIAVQMGDPEILKVLERVTVIAEFESKYGDCEMFYLLDNDIDLIGIRGWKMGRGIEVC